MKKLKIEIVHDLVCSWCPIGYSNIRKAIDNLGIEVKFERQREFKVQSAPAFI